jgi:hypothetical protein
MRDCCPEFRVLLQGRHQEDAMTSLAPRRIDPRLLLAAALLGAASAPALHGQVSAASYRVSFTGFGFRECDSRELPYPISCAVSHQTQDPTCPGQYAGSGLTSGGSVPAADVQASMSGCYGRSTGLARILYAAVVRSNEEPPPTTQVPLVVRIRGHASASGGGTATTEAEATATVSVLGVTGDASASSSPLNAPPYDEFDVTETVVVDVGTIFTADVLADVTLFAGGDHGQAEGQAVADPEITIDPTFPWASAFRVEYSPNIDALFIDGFEADSFIGWSATEP